jgi:hypothetical protein
MASSPCGLIRGFSELFGAESLTQVLIFLAKICPTPADVPRG